jgi:hypothetical protein
MQLKRMDHTLRPCLKKKLAAEVDKDARTQARTLLHIAEALTVLSGRVPQTQDKKWRVMDYTAQLKEVKSVSRCTAQVILGTDATTTPCSEVQVQASERLVMLSLCTEANFIKASIEPVLVHLILACHEDSIQVQLTPVEQELTMTASECHTHELCVPCTHQTASNTPQEGTTEQEPVENVQAPNDTGRLVRLHLSFPSSSAGRCVKVVIGPVLVQARFTYHDGQVQVQLVPSDAAHSTGPSDVQQRGGAPSDSEGTHSTTTTEAGPTGSTSSWSDLHEGGEAVIGLYWLQGTQNRYARTQHMLPAHAIRNLVLGRLYILKPEAYEHPLVPNEQHWQVKNEVLNLLQHLGHAGMLDRIEIDIAEVDQAIANLDAEEEQGFINSIRSDKVVIQVERINEIPGRGEYAGLDQRPLRDAAFQHIHSEFNMATINVNATAWDGLLLTQRSASKHHRLYAGLKRSCLPVCIIDAYYDSWMKDGKLKKTPLCMSLIAKVCKGTGFCYQEGDELELTVEEACRFFREYRLGFVMYDAITNEQLPHSYMPPEAKFHRSLRPRTLHLLYYNEHVVGIDSIKSFEAKFLRHQLAREEAGTDGEGAMSLQPNTMIPGAPGAPGARYRFWQPPKTESYQLASTADEVLRRYKEYIEAKVAGKHDGACHVLFSGDIKDVVIVLTQKAGLQLHVSMSNMSTSRTVASICIKNLSVRSTRGGEEPVPLHIHTAGSLQGRQDVEMQTIEEYQKLVAETYGFQSLLINRRHMSRLHPSVQEWYTQLSPRILCGSVGTLAQRYNDALEIAGVTFKGTNQRVRAPLRGDTDNFVMLDINKAYPHALATLPFIPVIPVFETFREIEETHHVADENMYIVHILSKVDTVYGHQEFTICPGWEVHSMREAQIHHALLAYLTAIPVADSMQDIRAGIKKVLQSDLPPEFRKGILNIAIGMCGKKWNRQWLSRAFLNADDAYMCYHEQCEPHKRRVDHVGPVTIISRIEQEDMLAEGFLPIRYSLLAMARMQLAQHVRMMEAQGLEVVAIKTDAIYIRTPPRPLQEYRIYSHVGTRPGQLKVEYNTIPGCFKPISEPKSMSLRPATFPTMQQPQVMTLQDEFNKTEAREAMSKLLQNGPTIIDGVAGSGKSRCALDFVLKKFNKDEILFVAPYNQQLIQAQQEGLHTCTFARLVGERPGHDKRAGGKDITKFKVLILDEVYLLPLNNLHDIHDILAAENNNICFIATGDSNQIKPVVGDNQVAVPEALRKQYVEHMFPHVLRLKINKRVAADDREDLDNMLNIIFDKNIPDNKVASHLLARYPNKVINSLEGVKGLKILRGISYTNDSAHILNAYMHSYYSHSRDKFTQAKTLSNGITYYYNGKLLCRKYIEANGGEHRFLVNSLYVIRGMAEDGFTLQEEGSKGRYKVPVDTIMTHFTLPYVNTGHSSQGSAIEEPYIVADPTFKHVDRNWLYTAVTRMRKFKHLYFLTADLGPQKHAKITRARKLLSGYKQQDEKAGRRAGDDEYWTPEELVELYERQPMCAHCHQLSSIMDTDFRQATLQRTDNNIGHTRANARTLFCRYCNVAVK